MVNLWGTFCGPCLQEMPDLGELADEYGDKGVQDRGNLHGRGEQRRGSAGGCGGDGEGGYPGTRERIIFILCPLGKFFTDLLPRVSAVPTTIFVDESGRQIGLADMGARDKDTWIQVIEEKLAEAGSEEQ